MAWCPICKAEYDDKDICPDCSVELIAGNENDYIEIFTFPNEEISLNIYNYLMELKFETIQYYYNAREDIYHILCQKYEEEDALKQMYFYITEHLDAELTPTERVALAKFTDKIYEEAAEYDDTPSAYVSSKDKYADIHSSASSLLIVGFIGLIMLIVDITGIYRFPFSGASRILFLVTLGIVFVLFLVLGVISLRKAKALSSAINDEDDTEREIISYLTDKIDLDSADIGLDEDASDEEKYLAITEYMQAMVEKEYPGTDEAFIEHIVEKAYDEIFG